MPSFCNVSGCKFTYDSSLPNDLKMHKRTIHVPEISVVYPNSTQEVVLQRDNTKLQCSWCNFSTIYPYTIQVRNYHAYGKINNWMILRIRNMPERNARVFLSFLQALYCLVNPPPLPLMPGILYFLGCLHLPVYCIICMICHHAVNCNNIAQHVHEHLLVINIPSDLPAILQLTYELVPYNNVVRATCKPRGDGDSKES